MVSFSLFYVGRAAPLTCCADKGNRVWTVNREKTFLEERVGGFGWHFARQPQMNPEPINISCEGLRVCASEKAEGGSSELAVLLLVTPGPIPSCPLTWEGAFAHDGVKGEAR